MLNLEMEFKKGILIVRLKGVLNGDTALSIDDNVTNIVRNNGIKYLLLNLLGLTYIDQYGLDIIIKNYKIIVKHEGKLLICCQNNFFNYTDELKDIYQISDEEVAFELVKL